MKSNFSQLNLPTQNAKPILCFYFNATHHLVLIRLDQEDPRAFERVVFPKERLLFEANSDAWLEVHCVPDAQSQLCDRIPCTQLRVLEPQDQPQNTLEDDSSSTQYIAHQLVS